MVRRSKLILLVEKIPEFVAFNIELREFCLRILLCLSNCSLIKANGRRIKKSSRCFILRKQKCTKYVTHSNLFLKLTQT